MIICMRYVLTNTSFAGHSPLTPKMPPSSENVSRHRRSYNAASSKLNTTSSRTSPSLYHYEMITHSIMDRVSIYQNRSQSLQRRIDKLKYNKLSVDAAIQELLALTQKMNLFPLITENKNVNDSNDTTQRQTQTQFANIRGFPGSNVQSTRDEYLPSHFFVYGTLRDDDDSGALWTMSWTAGCTASYGKLSGFKMYQKPGFEYPFAVRTGERSDFIVGRLVTWNDDKVVEEKRKTADAIEGYHEENAHVLFHRDIVDAEDAKGQMVRALVYHQPSPYIPCDAVPNGDWLQRKKK